MKNRRCSRKKLTSSSIHWRMRAKVSWSESNKAIEVRPSQIAFRASSQGVGSAREV